jgi:tRNA dimethylallyltransferase
MKEIVFIAGPTAVGKTAVSIYLAKMLNAEIVSCDSMQVYKGMDIGTQKPSPAQLGKIPHHMLSIISPSKIFSVADFRKKALRCMKTIEKKGKEALFTGGTALYMKALIDGLFPAPPADYSLREKLVGQENENGKGYLHGKLCNVDMETAKLLHPNDTRRIIRALEVYINTKIPMSRLKKQTKGLKERYDIKIFCLNRNRETLYRIIDKRVDLMFRKGLIRECRQLKDKKLSMTARQALGYKEVFDFIDGRACLNDTKDLIKQRTRNFAKRQLSWFRNDKRILWIDIDDYSPKEAADVLCRKFMK